MTAWLDAWGVAGGLIAAGLLVYLVAVLLNPEDWT